MVRTPVVSAAPPDLDATQRAVVEHRDGPLLVLAGPGTGKTTTLVEAVLARVRAGTAPERILVLTFSRKAAAELRDRMAARAAGTAHGSPQAATFHSFCYALVRAHQEPELFAEPIRLMSGPEQDLVVRELLAGQGELAREGRARVRWPDDLRAALTTRGFADEVRAVLARSRELGLGPRALGDFARRIGRPDWLAAAAFLEEYLDVTDLQGVIDYAELVHRAVRLVRRPEVHAELAGRYDAVFVDEYQDTDAAQVRLLGALAGQGRTLVAFGDPDQSIYAFRGADVNGILDFPRQFPSRDGGPAPVRVLTESRRAGAVLLAATRRFTERMPLPRLPSAAARAHRSLRAARGGGAVAVRTYPTPGAELDSIADTLRRAHLEEGIAWRDMAVLVRSATPLPALRRAFTSAGVPVDLDTADLPLHAEPAVAPLLLALRVSAESAPPRAVASPLAVSPAAAPDADPAPRGANASPRAADLDGPASAPTRADAPSPEVPLAADTPTRHLPPPPDLLTAGAPAEPASPESSASPEAPGGAASAEASVPSGPSDPEPLRAGSASAARQSASPRVSSALDGSEDSASPEASARSDRPDPKPSAGGAPAEPHPETPRVGVGSVARQGGSPRVLSALDASEDSVSPEALARSDRPDPKPPAGGSPAESASAESPASPGGAASPEASVPSGPSVAGAPRVGVGSVARQGGSPRVSSALDGSEDSASSEASARAGHPDPKPSAGGAPAESAAPEASGRPGFEHAAAGGRGKVVVSVEDAVALLASPLGGLDAADMRRLGRALREEERAAGHPVPRPSDVLIAEALAEPERLVAHDPAYARGALRLGRLLARARDILATGGTAEAALWSLWDGSPWPARLERAALRGGPAGRNADRDLDAVCALFETAARAEERTGGRGALNLIEELSGYDIAADTLGGRTVRPDAVRLMTAHRAKGLEWRLVVVAGVQEGAWPDLRRRGSLLEADRIGRDGLAPPLTPGALLAEERRLFYVAVTRARERLLVTAVKAAADDGDQPSRFLTELGVEPQDVTHRPRRPLAVAALVAELRATTVDPAASPALREAAARRLARMAALTDEGHPLIPAAHPDRWWGLYEPTRSATPLRDRDQPVALSGSALDQLARTCALQWFLGREVKAEPPSTAAQGFGNVVHVLADEVASGRAPADLDVLMARLDSVWDALAFDAPWKSRQEKENARAALERFLRWHVIERGRTAVATEHDFDVTLEAGDARVRIRGSMDRVETDAEGRAYVVDFKTGRNKPTAAEVAHHPQLAVYQLAVREGAVDALFGGRPPAAGGAELVQLRLGAAKKEGGDALPAVQRQEPLAGEWAEELLAEAAGRVLDERFTPATGQHCTHCAFRSSCTARPEGRHVVE
ncbi:MULTISPECIES: UvrD-helicase domain-containing protein [unclassified Streptomyces]|uniref:UvrD-helicase domain-containing protein n=1 Tax=unclassified Streptomyces TaxID=2593676 RepID=UPI002E2CA062|nr:UvrD-helicase domain-containing protein [Streptomyces sp. NBC_00223]